MSIPVNSLQQPESTRHGLMAFFNAMDEVFFSTDADLNLQFIATGCENIFGYSAEELIGKKSFWTALVHPADQQLIADSNRLLLCGETVRDQYRIINVESDAHWVRRSLIPVFDENKSIIRFDGALRDINNIKISEEKQRESQTLYRRILETAQEGMWTIDENEKTNFVNQKMCDILGYTEDEMLGKELFDFIPDEEIENVKACMERRRQGVKESFNIKYKAKNGSAVWTSISTNPIFDENGTYKGALAMVTDITGYLADEDARKKSEANIQAIFDNTDTAYILIDANRRILSFNLLAKKYADDNNGLQLEIGRSINDYFPAERWVAIQQMLEKVMAGEAVSYEIQAKRDGIDKWYNVRWLDVRDKQGKHFGFILANKEITESKAVALEREQITADLIRHNKDLEQFTYIVSHNLRSPVANIIGLNDILKDDDLDADMRNNVLEKMTQATKNIEAVIADLNDILQTRQLIHERKEQIFFSELVETIKTGIHITIINEQVQFNCDFSGVESLFSVRSYLYSIFYNLITNSIKYRRPDAVPVISIKSKKLTNGVELIFTDNGKGIDLEKNSQLLFGLYKRFDTGTEGKGMGLYMVKTQVEALKGDIQVKSIPGQGTEFTIRFEA